MKVRPEDAAKKQELGLLALACARAKPLPKGTKDSEEARFYTLARKWVPTLVHAYLTQKPETKT